MENQELILRSEALLSEESALSPEKEQAKCFISSGIFIPHLSAASHIFFLRQS